MKYFSLLLAMMSTMLGGTLTAKDQAAPYLGKWSNGRGETLVISPTTVKFAKDKPVAYREIASANGGKTFHLEISVKKDTNYFFKFMTLTLKDGKEMHTESYAAQADKGHKNNASVTWHRD